MVRISVHLLHGGYVVWMFRAASGSAVCVHNMHAVHGALRGSAAQMRPQADTSPCRLPAGDALASAGKIAAHTGAVLLCENAFTRLDRGAGLPCPRRLPYFPQDAAAELAKYELLLLVDTRPPVATFGYK